LPHGSGKGELRNVAPLAHFQKGQCKMTNSELETIRTNLHALGEQLADIEGQLARAQLESAATAARLAVKDVRAAEEYVTVALMPPATGFMLGGRAITTRFVKGG
jgi:hypothetical protein